MSRSKPYPRSEISRSLGSVRHSIQSNKPCCGAPHPARSRTISSITQSSDLIAGVAFQSLKFHPHGHWFPHVGLVFTDLLMEPEWIIRFFNQRGTAQDHIRAGKFEINWTRLFCKRFRANEDRLRPHAHGPHLGSFIHRTDLPEEIVGWSLISIQSRLLKIGARVVRHARKIMFQKAEVALSGDVFGQIIAEGYMTAQSTKQTQMQLRSCALERHTSAEIHEKFDNHNYRTFETSDLNADNLVKVANAQKRGQASRNSNLLVNNCLK